MDIELIEKEDRCEPSQPAPGFELGARSTATVTIELPEVQTEGFSVIISPRSPQSVDAYRKATRKSWKDRGYRWRGDDVADAGKGEGWLYSFTVSWLE